MTHAAKVTVFLGISLDGFIAGPGGDLAWLSECATESPTDTGYDELMGRTDALVLGRNTYEAVRQFSDWPFEGKRVYVMTHRPLVPAHGEIALQGNIARKDCHRLGGDSGIAARLKAAWCRRLIEISVRWSRWRNASESRRELVARVLSLSGSLNISAGVRCAYV